jgi:hypothetical protein
MTARITRDFHFTAGVYFEDELYMNFYECNLQFSVESESISEQNIALERVKYFISSLEHNIFIHQQNETAIEKLTQAGVRVCVIPEEPYDQIIAIMLLVKMNAITEGRLVADDIGLMSRMSDGVTCLHSFEENTGPFRLKGWWNDSSPKITNTTKKTKKIVKLQKSISSWEELGLGYVNKKEPQQTEIVFARFESKSDK